MKEGYQIIMENKEKHASVDCWSRGLWAVKLQWNKPVDDLDWMSPCHDCHCQENQATTATALQTLAQIIEEWDTLNQDAARFSSSNGSVDQNKFEQAQIKLSPHIMGILQHGKKYHWARARSFTHRQNVFWIVPSLISSRGGIETTFVSRAVLLRSVFIIWKMWQQCGNCRGWVPDVNHSWLVNGVTRPAAADEAHTRQNYPKKCPLHGVRRSCWYSSYIAVKKYPRVERSWDAISMFVNKIRRIKFHRLWLLRRCLFLWVRQTRCHCWWK